MTDTRKLLRLYLERRQWWPFRWGFHDCFTFTADWVADITGERSPADEYRNKYSGAVGAMRHLIRRGGRQWDDVPRLLYPVSELSPSYASCGDVVSVTDPAHGPCLGICDGPSAVFLGDNGIYQRRAHRDIERAWRVMRECPKSARPLQQ